MEGGWRHSYKRGRGVVAARQFTVARRVVRPDAGRHPRAAGTPSTADCTRPGLVSGTLRTYLCHLKGVHELIKLVPKRRDEVLQLVLIHWSVIQISGCLLDRFYINKGKSYFSSLIYLDTI